MTSIAQVLNADLGGFAQDDLEALVAGLGGRALLAAAPRPVISLLAATWLKPYWPALKNDSKRWGWQLALTRWMPFSQLVLPV